MLRNLLIRARNNEEGNSLVLFLVTFPIITLIFGFIVDSLLLNYAKSAVQSSADSAALVLASSMELSGFSGTKYIDVYRGNIDNAKMVLNCKTGTCGANIGYSMNTTTKRVCVTVSEKVNFVFLDSLPFGLFGSAGANLQSTISSFADIKIVNPGTNTEANLKNKVNDYACAIIK